MKTINKIIIALAGIAFVHVPIFWILNLPLTTAVEFMRAKPD